MPSEGKFGIDTDYTYALVVQGSTRMEKPPPPSLSTSATESASSSSSSSLHSRYGGLKASTTTIRVVKAIMDKNKNPGGRVEFKLQDTLHINLSSSTANIPYIQAQIQEQWGPGLIVVSNDGLPIGDNKATRGTHNLYLLRVLGTN